MRRNINTEEFLREYEDYKKKFERAHLDEPESIIKKYGCNLKDDLAFLIITTSIQLKLDNNIMSGKSSKAKISLMKLKNEGRISKNKHITDLPLSNFN